MICRREYRRRSTPPVDGGQTVKAICYGAKNLDVLHSRDEGAVFLWKLASYIGMKGVEDVRVQFGPQYGHSVVLVIEESHIAIHTWIETGDIRIIVDSCKNFPLSMLKKFLNRELCPEYMFLTKTCGNRPACWHRIVWWVRCKLISRRRKDDAGRNKGE